MEPQPAFELDTHPPTPFNNERAQEIAANIWRDMPMLQPKERALKPVPLNDDKEPKPFSMPPESPKARFDEPFSPDKARQLIDRLGASKYSERESAQDKLTRMGEPAIPLLEEARKRSKDLEVQSRTESTVNNIRAGVERNISIDLRQISKENEADWKTLLEHAGKSIIDQTKAPLIMNEAGEVVPLGISILVGPGKSAPTKEEQTRYDKMLDQFRAIPDFTSILKRAQERANLPDSTPKERMDFQQLNLLDIAKESAQLDYARALSASNDPADLKKGRNLVVDYLNERNLPLDNSDNFRILGLALDLHSEADPAFLAAFKKAGGNTERLEEMRLDRIDRENVDRVRAQDREKREAREKDNLPLDDKFLADLGQTWDAMKPQFRDLLTRVGSLPDGELEKDALPRNARDLHITNFGNHRTPPTKDEQQKIDQMIKSLDELPFFERIVEHSRGIKQLRNNNLPENVMISDLLHAKGNSRELYASALSSSKDPADLEKGRKLLIEHLNQTQELMVDDDGRRVAMLSMRLGVDKDPAFRTAYANRAGNLEGLNAQRVLWDKWERDRK